MAAATLHRISFALGVVGVLASIAAGAVSHVIGAGTAPPLMQHPLDPARDALAAGDAERFVSEHRMFTAIQPRDATAHLKLANVLVRTGDEVGAIEALEDALLLSPVPPLVHARLARLYFRYGRVSEAREQARAAVALGAPIQPALLRRLGLPEPSR